MIPRVPRRGVAVLALTTLAFVLGTASVGGCRRKSAAHIETESTGVPECDAYVTRYEACLERRGPDEREAAEQGFEAQRSALKLNAATDEERHALAEQCRATLEAIKPTCGE